VDPSELKNRRKHMRRWAVLLGCSIGMAVSISSMLTFPFGLYMKAVAADFGWSRPQFSVTLSFVAICNMVMLPPAGFAVDCQNAAGMVR
jgi:hypothetical protein